MSKTGNRPETYIAENSARKIVASPYYNYVFDKETGYFARWGETKEQDPWMSPLGPEIADIEISTVCNGIGKDMSNRKPCSWCYKSNTGCGENMTLDTFKKVFHLLCNTQIELIIENKQYQFPWNKEITLTNGTKKLAIDLTENDDIILDI